MNYDFGEWENIFLMVDCFFFIIDIINVIEKKIIVLINIMCINNCNVYFCFIN